jgi:NAD(P)-dependent dehydrogenase (short-subunit alcohol dehydrogenase family)
MSESNLIALVTGANQGIGLATAHVLSQRGYTVIMACRDPSKAVDAVKAWSDTEQQQARPFKLDLADLSSVKKFAKKIQKKFKHIDALILNAGVSPESYQKTPQNHLPSESSRSLLSHQASPSFGEGFSTRKNCFFVECSLAHS